MHADVTRAISRLNEMLTWLTTLANAADNHFWNTAAVELAQLGAVTADPLAVSDDLCLGATEACEIVLRETALVTGASHTPLDWSTSERTLNTTSMYSIAAGIRTALSTITTVASPPSGGYTHQPMSGAGANIYNQVKALIDEIGPRFPTPITCFYPDAAVTGIEAEIGADPNHVKIKLTLTGGSWPAGTDWHELKQGDTVVFTALEMTTAEYLALLNAPMVVTANPVGAVLYLTLPEPAATVGVAAEPLIGGTGLRDLFVLRKIRGLES